MKNKINKIKKINNKNWIYKLFKSKYFYISSAIIIGLLLTIFFSNKIFNCDIIFALGSGIFGSAVVTFMIEILNDIRKEKNIKRQKKFTFADVKADILFILQYEIYNFSSYCSIYSDNENNDDRKETVENILKLLNDYCDRITNYLVEDHKPKDIIADNTWLDNENNKDRYLCSDALPYYERLLKNINIIIDNRHIFFNSEVLDEQGYDELKMLSIILHFLVVYSNSKSRDYTIDYKQQFLENVTKTFNLLEIETNQKIDIRF